MSSLYNVKLENIINIEEQKWKDVISMIYTNESKKLNFCMNSELIDVKNRFKIVKKKEKIYIIKKTSLEKAKLEIKNAKKINKLIKYKKTKEINIIPIIPSLINIGKDYFLISEYKGTTLQENLYSKNEKNKLSFNKFSKINKLLFDNGIIYRGFIPRNIIINKKYIYMIDFEDAIIYKNKKNIHYDLLFVTNFILNWQYFYKREELEQLINSIKIKYNENKHLIKYEKKYKDIMGYKINNLKLRNKIKNTVINSEKPSIYQNINNYEIMPNDLVHLISDILDYNYDVLFDLISEKIREENEIIYYKYLKIFSNVIYILKEDISKMKFYILIIITMYIETYTYNLIIFDIKDNFTISELNKKIEESQFLTAKLILKLDISNLKISYKKTIEDALKKISESNKKINIVDEIMNTTIKIINNE